MPNEQLLQLINDTAELLILDEAVIEKDYYVTQVIHALSNIENEHFRLIFCGGTCLAKAHKIVKRMSEDVDFKIHFKSHSENFSKSRMLKELKQFRVLISSKLKIEGLIASEPVVRNEGKYSRIDLTYPSYFAHNHSLRPHILLEFTLSDIQLPFEVRKIQTLIEDAMSNINLFEPAFTVCISISETAIEKWVGLTRRIIAIERSYHPDDETLIRHVYDLNAINQSEKITSDFYSLATSIIHNDANQFKNQHPEYSENPANEIRQSLSVLKSKEIWKKRYENFIETMVYERSHIPDYDHAVTDLKRISEKVLTGLL